MWPCSSKHAIPVAKSKPTQSPDQTKEKSPPKILKVLSNRYQAIGPGHPKRTDVLYQIGKPGYAVYYKGAKNVFRLVLRYQDGKFVVPTEDGSRESLDLKSADSMLYAIIKPQTRHPIPKVGSTAPVSSTQPILPPVTLPQLGSFSVAPRPSNLQGSPVQFIQPQSPSISSACTPPQKTEIGDSPSPAKTKTAYYPSPNARDLHPSPEQERQAHNTVHGFFGEIPYFQGSKSYQPSEYVEHFLSALENTGLLPYIVNLPLREAVNFFVVLIEKAWGDLPVAIGPDGQPKDTNESKDSRRLLLTTVMGHFKSMYYEKVVGQCPTTIVERSEYTKLHTQFTGTWSRMMNLLWYCSSCESQDFATEVLQDMLDEYDYESQKQFIRDVARSAMLYALLLEQMVTLNDSPYRYDAYMQTEDRLYRGIQMPGLASPLVAGQGIDIERNSKAHKGQVAFDKLVEKLEWAKENNRILTFPSYTSMDRSESTAQGEQFGGHHVGDCGLNHLLYIVTPTDKSRLVNVQGYSRVIEEQEVIALPGSAYRVNRVEKPFEKYVTVHIELVSAQST